MIQLKTLLDVVDNTGAKQARCIQVLGDSKRRYAHVGDIIVANVIKWLPGSAFSMSGNRDVRGKARVVKGVVVRTRSAIRREDGSYVRFDRNAMVILDIDMSSPKGTRIFGAVPRELRAHFMKIISLAAEVV